MSLLGIDLILKLGSTGYAGETGATLELSSNASNVAAKLDGAYGNHLPTIRQGSISTDGMVFLDRYGNGPIAVTAGVPNVSIWNEDPDGDPQTSDSAYQALQGVTSVTLSPEQNLIEVTDGDSGNDRELSPEERNLTIEVEGRYEGPSNDPAYKVVTDEFLANNRVSLKVDGITGLDFSPANDGDLNATIADFTPVDASKGDAASYSITFNINGSWSLADATNQDSVLAALLQAYDDQTELQADFAVIDTDGNDVSGEDAWSASVLPSSSELSFSHDDDSGFSSDFEITGAVTYSQQT